MTSAIFFLVAVVTYFATIRRTRDLFTPSALLCLFWFAAASIADMASLKDPVLQQPWEMETYAAIYLSGLTVFTVGFAFGKVNYPRRFVANPTVAFRRTLNILAVLSICAVMLRLYIFGFSIENLILSFGSGDIKDEMSEAIPGVHYFEILTPYVCLCAIYELISSDNMSRSRRWFLRMYVFYAIVLYCIILSASRGTLLIVLTGVMALYSQSGRLKPTHLALLGLAVIGLMSALSFLRMPAETVSNSFLGDQAFQTFFSPIYTYVAFNFENFNTLVRSDISPSYIFYSLKSLLWPFFKGDYEAELIRLVNFETLFFNARTYLYPFYHDLGLIGCILYPGAISYFLTRVNNSAAYDKSRLMLLMGLQKPIWFAFFGNYFFGELVIIIPLLLLFLMSALYGRSGDLIQPLERTPGSLPGPQNF